MEDKSHARELAREFAEAVDAAKEKLTFLCTDGWAGHIETPCEILEETPKRFLVRLGGGLLSARAPRESRSHGLRSEVRD